jgi:hypothetical protein
MSGQMPHHPSECSDNLGRIDSDKRIRAQDGIECRMFFFDTDIVNRLGLGSGGHKRSSTRGI